MIFVLGLAKKVIIADSMAEFSSPFFDAVQAGGQPQLIEARIGALSYTLQLYFDFLRLFRHGNRSVVELPMNFNSPYQATSIIKFWRRWHMTLSRFLRDYLYIPLGGGRTSKSLRYFNLMITMLLGGLWHGAGWTFIIWGGLHGCYLMINHTWRNLKQRMGWRDGGKSSSLAAGSLTFLMVVVGWDFFGEISFSPAMAIFQGMLVINELSKW